MLLADTAALKTGSRANDSRYGFVSSEIKALGTARDAVASQIKNELYNAEFNGAPLLGVERNLFVCRALLAWAGALAETSG